MLSNELAALRSQERGIQSAGTSAPFRRGRDCGRRRRGGGGGGGEREEEEEEEEGEEEEEEEDILSLAEEKYRPAALEKMIALVALLVEQSRSER